jgi:hypothetical protein
MDCGNKELWQGNYGKVFIVYCSKGNSIKGNGKGGGEMKIDIFAINASNCKERYIDTIKCNLFKDVYGTFDHVLDKNEIVDYHITEKEEKGNE